MRKNKIPVRFTGQHFTVDQVLIADAIRIAEIKEKDTVLDIGAGKGFLTVHLAKKCRKVIAIENDRALSSLLRKRFLPRTNVRIVECDFRRYIIPYKAFKIVSNIPYGITAEVLKSLMYEHVESFLGGSLVMQLEAAQKLFAKKVFNPWIIFYHTFFDLTLSYEIPAESFIPPPTVRSALLKIKRKKEPHISIEMKKRYLDFLFFMLKKPEAPVQMVLKKLFRKKQFRVMAARCHLKADCRVNELTSRQWAACFHEMLKAVPERYRPSG